MKKLIPLLILMLITCSDTVKLVDVPPEKCIPKQETCNNVDDDCDKIVDNEDQIGIKPCYSGNTSDLLNGVCRFGVERCINGKEVCIGQIKPIEELCNGLDDDCDGQTDEGYSSAGLDIVFAIDYSGSMSDKISTINAVVSSWTNTFANKQNIRLALVGIPPYEDGYDATVKILSNLTDYYSFNTILQENKYAGANGNEPSIDAIYKISDPTNPLGINWRSNYGKAIFVFTDEWPQSYTSIQITEVEALAMANNNSVRVFIFTTDNNWRAWHTYPLTSSSALLSIDIESAISQAYCK